MIHKPARLRNLPPEGGSHGSVRGAARLIAGYGAVASALPYLALKVLWIGGGTLGVADRSMMRESSMVVLNAITAAMDVVGITLALAFTHHWGQRIPAWLLLPPMWVATGLLGRFVVGVPIAAILSALAPHSFPRITGGPVEGWVYLLVYLEFAGLGIGLIVAFFFYATTRWTELFEAPAYAVPPRASYDVQVVVANATASVAMLLGVLSLAWAFGATVGLPQEVAARRTIVGALINGIDGVLTLAAGAGVLLMIHRTGEHLPKWLPLAMTWAGTGSLFGWGLWQTINVLGETALMQGTGGGAFVKLVGLLRMLVGLIMGLLTLFVIAEHRDTASTVPNH